MMKNIKISTLSTIIFIILSLSSIFLKAFGFNNELILLILLFFIMVMVLYKNSISICINYKFLFFIFGSMIFSTLINDMINNSVSVVNFVYDILFLLIILMGIILGRKIYDVNKLSIFKIHIIILFFMCLFLIYEYITKNNLLLPYFYVDNLSNIYPYRCASFFVHPVTCASFLIYGFWLVYFFVNNSKYKYIFITMIIFSLYATGSRSSWIALAITIIIYFIRNIKPSISYKTILKSFIGVIIGIVFLNTNTGSNMINSIIQRFSNVQSFSYSQRLGSIEYIINRFFEKSSLFQLLFGHGQKGAYDAMLETTIAIPGFFTTDNTYLTILYDYGLVVFISVIIFLFIILRTIFKTKDKVELCLSIILLSQAISSFFFEFTLFMNIAFFNFFYIGLWISRHSKPKKLLIIK